MLLLVKILIPCRFPHIDDVARTLSLYLSEELVCILKYPIEKNEMMRLFERE